MPFSIEVIRCYERVRVGVVYGLDIGASEDSGLTVGCSVNLWGPAAPGQTWEPVVDLPRRRLTLPGRALWTFDPRPLLSRFSHRVDGSVAHFPRGVVCFQLWRDLEKVADTQWVRLACDFPLTNVADGGDRRLSPYGAESPSDLPSLKEARLRLEHDDREIRTYFPPEARSWQPM